jgi:uncharacterized protein YjdB/N-acetylmuramoyl-L-alanine amidase CwlA
VVWTSSDELIATVTNGVVSLLKAGEVTIKATVGAIEQTHVITVSDPIVDVESITISGLTEGLVGEEITLTAEVLPTNATNKDVVWTSSDELIATVTNGVVSLLKAGEVTIKATVGAIEQTHVITVSDPIVLAESITISGLNQGLVGQDIQLTAEVLPLNTTNKEVTWQVDITSFAQVTNGTVGLIRAGVVTITATVGDVSTTHVITIKNPVAMINNVYYESIQSAIDAAVKDDVIVVLAGTHDESLTINKSDISFVSQVDKAAILTKKIALGSDLVNISFNDFSFTGDAQITSKGTLTGFTFENNHVYDTNLVATPYAPVNRIDVNAFIQFYRLASSDIFGDIYINNNLFENIQSDIISLDRTKVGTEINITNNEFRNFEISAIRFDGGYNNGTYNITGNNFENDELQAFSAITFRAYAPAAGNVQTILIENNSFKNIGTPSKDRNGLEPGSGVITTGTFNSNQTVLTINNNEFVHTFNSVHLKGASSNWTASLTNNVFKDTLGYVYFENGRIATISDNQYLDRLGEPVETNRLVFLEDPNYRTLTITDPTLTFFSITGEANVEVGDVVAYDLEATPPYYLMTDVIWASTDETIATVSDNVVTFLKAGEVTITATYDGMMASIVINVADKVAAKINDVSYNTIQSAIDQAVANDVILVQDGTFNEALTINKSITLKGALNGTSILTNVITISPNQTNITMDGFTMTKDFKVTSSGPLVGFNFINNHVTDSTLASSGYTPNSRVNVNAIIQFGALSGSDLFGDIRIEDNVFENIKADIISIHRTKVGTEINILNNEFRNFTTGAIRFDGGYNNGTYNITGNLFKNDVKQAESAILFRAYSSSSGNVQTINITENTFENIGNEANNPTSSYPASAVIGTSTYNSNETYFNVLNNDFINTHNTVHFRKNETTTKWHATVSNNTFTSPTGYMFYEDGQYATVSENIILNEALEPVAENQIDDSIVSNARTIKVKDVIAKYAVLTYTFNEDTQTYDIEETLFEGVVGKKVVITPEAKLGYYTDQADYSGIIQKDGSMIIEIYYHLDLINPDAFEYELALNGGNFEYATRDEMVRDFIKDYNTVNGKNYTLETLGMSIWGDTDYERVFYHEVYRDKWLWMAAYLGEVGSTTNKKSASDILKYQTEAEWRAVSGNWIYAFSYEVRGFLKGIKFDGNANWASADYSNLDLQNGFWQTYADYNVESIYVSKGAVETLPTVVYKDGYDFIGWFDNEALLGEPILEITEPKKLYAKFEEKNPVTSIEVSNPVTELEKGSTYQLNMTILPVDAYNKTLIYQSSNMVVASVSETGLISALNEGDVVITITNYNGLIKQTLTLHVYPADDVMFNFSDGFNGYVSINDTFTFEAYGVGKTYENQTFTYEIDHLEVLENTTDQTFKALQSGRAQINVYKDTELVGAYTVVVQDTMTESRVDQLLTLLANANNTVAQGVNVVPYYTATQEWIDSRHESVNLFLFDDFVVDRTNYLADPTKKSSGLKSSTEFILVHDTANLNSGLITHGNFFKSETNSVSVHYTTGDYGILQTLENDYIAWHAGDGTSVPFEWINTGITATSLEKPLIDISTDGYYTFNGIKSSVVAPTGPNGLILDRSYFTYLGPNWDIFDGKYVIGTTYFTTSQQSRGVIASRGGNRNSIGIEMNVNTNGDIIDTTMRTAKLVANLLEEYQLPIHRVITHNTTDGKGDSYTLNNTVYNGTWYFDRFIEHVEVERAVLKDFSDAVITFSSDSNLVSSTGRVISQPLETTEVEYTITVTIGEVTKSITLISVVPGINTWSQQDGFYQPTQAWAKADYRK